MPTPEPKFAQVRAARIDLEFALKAGPQHAWQALTSEIGLWWPAAYSVKPERFKSFHLEPKLGGLIYEDWGAGSGWVWWTIHEWNPIEKAFAASGLLETATATSAVRFAIDEGADGMAVLRVSERVWGEIALETETSHTHGWTELIQNSFKPFVKE